MTSPATSPRLQRQQVYPVPSSRLRWADKLAIRTSISAGVCPVCGKPTVFAKFVQNLRESGLCVNCRSRCRDRQLATAMLEAVREMTGQSFSSLRDFASKAAHHAKTTSLRIYNTQVFGCLQQTLQAVPGYVSSEYFGADHKSGEQVNGILHQDLMQTSFADGEIDLLLSSDVFEHIPDPYKAFAEVHRILKPGGRHLFTVPFYQEAFHDEVRTYLDESGNRVDQLPPIFHDDPIRPDEGALVYTIFSLEMLIKLTDMGYNVRMYNTWSPWKGILGANALVFDTIKRA